MKVKVFCFIYFACLLCGERVFSQESKMALSFEDALNLSYKNNSIFKQNNLLKKEKIEERKAAFGLYLPQVSLSANYIHMGDNLHLDLSPVRDAITPLYDALGNYGSFKGIGNPLLPSGFGLMGDPTTGKPIMKPDGTPRVFKDSEVTSILQKQFKQGSEHIKATNWDQMIQKKNFGTLSANLMWPIYAGGKIRAANKVALLNQEGANIEAEQNTYAHINQMVERYYALCLASQVREVRKEVFNAMKNHLSDAEKMYKTGLIAKVQYLHAKVYFDDSDRELKKSERQLNVVKQALNNTLGIDGSVDIITMSNLFYTKDIKNVSYYKTLAIENSLILKQIENKKQLATQKYKVERSDLLPSVAVIGMYDIANKDLSTYMPEYMAGVGLKWNIFSGQKSYRKTKAAKLVVDRVSEIKYKYNLDINTGITKYYQTLQMLIEQLDALDSSMKFANEYYFVREKSFKEGMATSTELVDASLAVTKVKIERLKVLYDFDVCLSKLLELSGVSNDFVKIQKSSEIISE